MLSTQLKGQMGTDRRRDSPQTDRQTKKVGAADVLGKNRQSKKPYSTLKIFSHRHL